MKRTSKRRTRRLTPRRAIRALWRFPLYLLADILEDPMIWLALAALLLSLYGFPATPSLVR